MKLQEYYDLVDRFEASGLTCLEIEDEEFKIHMEKGAGGRADGISQRAIGQVQNSPENRAETMAQNSGAQAGVPSQTAGGQAETMAQNSGGQADAALVQVKAPIVGVFYAAPAPGEAPFVTAGSRVEKGQVLCLLEAMKMMNELKSPADGILRTVRGIDGELAEYDQVLFEVEPC